MVQHTGYARQIRHDLVRHLQFRLKERHPQKERRHHGVLFEKACGYSQRNIPTGRNPVLYRGGSDGEVQPHTRPALPLCEMAPHIQGKEREIHLHQPG